MQDPQEVMVALREALGKDPRFGQGRIRISLLGPRQLALEGEVATLAAKQQATELARQLAPTFGLDNALTVALNRPAPDAVLAVEAEAALRAANLPPSVGVEVRRGVAHLVGSAESPAQRDYAAHVVGQVPGLSGILLDHLGLAPRPSRRAPGEEEGA